MTAEFGTLIVDSDVYVEKCTCETGVIFSPKGHYGPLVLTRVRTNDEAAYGTFNKCYTTCWGDSSKADIGVPHDGPYGDLRTITVAGNALVKV